MSDTASHGYRQAGTDTVQECTYKNVVYGSDIIQQSMDVHLPAHRDSVNTPVVVLVHGGAWHSGDKSDFQGHGYDSQFIANGFAVININYRLDEHYSYPAPLEDIGSVVAFVSNHSAVWRVNRDKICLLGVSSGGQLASLYAYSQQSNGNIKAVIQISSLTDFTAPDLTPLLSFSATKLLGERKANELKWKNASPVIYAQAAVPTVIIHGRADSLIYFSQALLLRDSLVKYHIPNMFIPVDSEGHAINEPKLKIWRQTAIDWMKKYM